MKPGIRILGLGNDLLGDDALGHEVCRQLNCHTADGVEIITTSESGFALIDYLQGTDYLLIVDSMLTGAYPPGTLRRVDIDPAVVVSSDLSVAPGNSPHFTGILEPLLLARVLGQVLPKEIVILAVEVADPFTVGGRMDDRVVSSIPQVAALAGQILGGWASHL